MKHLIKDKKIDLYYMEKTPDGQGGYRAGWTLKAQGLWCYTKQLSEELIARFATLNRQETRQFVINHREIGNPDTVRIKYRGNMYAITRVDTKDDYNGDIFLYGAVLKK